MVNGATKTHTAQSLIADSIVVTFVLLINGIINTWLGTRLQKSKAGNIIYG